MQSDFPYEPGYIGELTAFSPRIAEDLERLLRQLDPALSAPVTKERVPHFKGDSRFRQIIAVEERDGRPAIVGTANISFMKHSYDSDGQLTDIPALALGSFVVDENVRGKGVAARIWNTVLDVGREEGIQYMQFTSRPSRGAAHGFYAKMGAVQITPVIGVKFKADGTERNEGTVPAFEAQLELAKGFMSFIFSSPGAERIDEATARRIIAASGTERFEQLIPVPVESDEATSVLFSVSL
jgi:GNAT superfamily N-acetyltransferase